MRKLNRSEPLDGVLRLDDMWHRLDGILLTALTISMQPSREICTPPGMTTLYVPLPSLPSLYTQRTRNSGTVKVPPPSISVLRGTCFGIARVLPGNRSGHE